MTDTAGKSSTATVQVTVFGNFVGNSGFETDLTGWNTSGSGTGASLARVSGGHSGGWAAKLSNNQRSQHVPPERLAQLGHDAAAGTYTGSLWARADTAGAILKLRFREYNGNTLVASPTTQATLTTSWQQVTVTHTTVSPGAGDTLDFSAYVSQAAPGTCFYADDVSISIR